MSKQEIRDSSNKLVGYIEDQGNGKLRAYDTMNRHKGTYDENSNKTYTPNNSIVGSGNQLVMLIFGR